MIEELQKRKKVLIEYLLMKVDEGDFHAVADAAMDLRELDARLSIYLQYEEKK